MRVFLRSEGPVGMTELGGADAYEIDQVTPETGDTARVAYSGDVHYAEFSAANEGGELRKFDESEMPSFWSKIEKARAWIDASRLENEVVETFFFLVRPSAASMIDEERRG